MKRTKRLTLRRVALGLAVVAVLAPAAQAKPTPTKSTPTTQMGRAPAHDFWTYDASGSNVAIAPDDVAFSRPSNVGNPSVANAGSGFELGLGTVSGFSVALVLLIGGSALALRHGRKTRLSPA